MMGCREKRFILWFLYGSDNGDVHDYITKVTNHRKVNNLKQGIVGLTLGGLLDNTKCMHGL